MLDSGFLKLFLEIKWGVVFLFIENEKEESLSFLDRQLL